MQTIWVVLLCSAFFNFLPTIDSRFLLFKIKASKHGSELSGRSDTDLDMVIHGYRMSKSMKCADDDIIDYQPKKSSLNDVRKTCDEDAKCVFLYRPVCSVGLHESAGGMYTCQGQPVHETMAESNMGKSCIWVKRPSCAAGESRVKGECMCGEGDSCVGNIRGAICDPNRRQCICSSEVEACKDGEYCKDGVCSVNGQWEKWGEYGECSRSCGPGYKERTRKCTGRIGNGMWCQGDDTEKVSCTKDPICNDLYSYAHKNTICKDAEQPVRPCARLYTDAYYLGLKKDLDEGEGDIHDRNDQVSSIRVNQGCTLTVYRDMGYKGMIFSLSEDLKWFDKENDKMSSYRCMCDDATMIRDHQRDNKKCGDIDATSRLFKLEGNDATETRCQVECSVRANCVSMSGVWGIWCIGCNTNLDVKHDDAKAFVKREMDLDRLENAKRLCDEDYNCHGIARKQTCNDCSMQSLQLCYSREAIEKQGWRTIWREDVRQDCIWETWTPWSNCISVCEDKRNSESCLKCKKTRSRNKHLEKLGGKPCDGEATEETVCSEAETCNAHKVCRWFGTAPTCEGACPSGWSYIRRDGSGDGAGCWTGWKNYCCQIQWK